MHIEGSYACESCGEEIVIPIDVSEGLEQQMVEDCPVCCHPHELQIRVYDDGAVRVEGRLL